LKRNLQISWETTVRADYVKEERIDDEFLDKLKQTGCYLLSFGAESGSPRILAKIKKDITPEDVINSAKNVFKTWHYSAIFIHDWFAPEKKKEDMMMTLNLIDRLIKIKVIKCKF